MRGDIQDVGTAVRGDVQDVGLAVRGDIQEVGHTVQENQDILLNQSAIHTLFLN